MSSKKFIKALEQEVVIDYYHLNFSAEELKDIIYAAAQLIISLPAFTVAAKVAHAGIKGQECTSGPLCPISAAGPLLTFEPAKRFCCLSVE